MDTTEIEPPQKNKSSGAALFTVYGFFFFWFFLLLFCLLWFSSPSVSYEDKLKENFARGSAELEKRRLALEEEQRKERERREREEREAQERREREARELENRRRLEEESRMERVGAVFRRASVEMPPFSAHHPLLYVQAAKQEMERQRREEWERAKREELGRRKEAEQEEIVRLRARKKSLELELEAVGNKHKQITDRLRDAQSMRRIQKAEVDLINQKRDARIAEINTLQLEFEEWQRKLSQLVPEQQRLSEKLRNISLKKLPRESDGRNTQTRHGSSGNCRRLKDQLDVLEKETTDKLTQMEQYNKELKLGDMDDCLLRGLLSLLACLSQLFLLIKVIPHPFFASHSIIFFGNPSELFFFFFFQTSSPPVFSPATIFTLFPIFIQR
uniref:Uncharacterized protein n=1 Tax=Poecilia latipinna TaxID=48699 RepID=A0A3B3W0L8_9TELE